MQSLSRRLGAIVVALLLTACGSTPSPESGSSSGTTVNYTSIEQDSAFYFSLAQRNSGDTAAGYRLLAVGALLGEEQDERAAQIYAALPTQWADAEARSLALLIESELALNHQQADAAVRKLKAVPERELSQQFKLWRARLLGEAYRLTGDPIEAARQLAIVAASTDDPAARQALHDSIWSLLADVSPFTLVGAATAPAPDPFSGWLRLAALHQEGQKDPQRYVARLTQLREQYPNHPAFALPPAPMAMVLTLETTTPQRVAVLLPLSGRNQSLGEAIRDGMVHAVLSGATSIELQFIDTASGMDKALTELASSNAELVIGPLLKPDVEAMLAKPPSQPWLALNRSPGGWPAASLQFALAPEDEAEQTAQRMAQDGIRHPLVLVPATSVGSRVSGTFDSHWQQLAGPGHAAVVASYGDRKGVQQTVANALGIGGSQARIRELRQTTGLDLQAEPRSRRDIDAIYLYGNPAEARFIKPTIESSLSGSAAIPPIYASASAHELSNGDSELAGVLISDMPLLLANDGSAIETLKLVRTTWPQRSAQELRLFALGHDALLLVPGFRYLAAFPGYEVRGLTGTLHARDGQIHRNVDWARIGTSATERLSDGQQQQ